MRNSTFYSELNGLFKPCKNLSSSDDIKKLENLLEDAVVEIAQYNYPYEVKFFNAMPANPVNYTCNKIIEYERENVPFSIVFENAYNFALNKYNKLDKKTKQKLNYLKIAAETFLNYTGSLKCLDIGNDNETVLANLNGWDFMACSEMVMPMEKDGVTDMFNAQKWDLEQFKKECKSKWNTDVKEDWAFNFYGGRNYMKDFKDYSNIFFY